MSENRKRQIVLDHVGEKYSSLVIISDVSGNSHRYCECKCICGKIVLVQYNNLVSGNTKSCGCRKIGKPAYNSIDRSGQTFNFWTILNYVETRNKQRLYTCKCKCGRISIRPVKDIVIGVTKSCGCFQSNRGTHKKSKQRIYNIWSNMKARCNNPNNKKYEWYGGKGIKVCKRWQDSFENFYDDVGEPTTSKHTLDRYPNADGNYEPGNVRWATMREQSNNKSSNRLFEIDGVTHNLTEWCDIYKLNYKTVHQRLFRGSDILTALNKPISTNHKKKTHVTRV